MIEALRRAGAVVDVEVEQEEDRARGWIVTPRGDRWRVSVETTPRGNGCLSIGNLMVRLLDEHDDGVVHEHSCLGVRFVDLDGDRIDDLVVEGNAVQTDAPCTTIPVRGVFVFDVVRGRFEIVSLVGPVGFAWLRDS